MMKIGKLLDSNCYAIGDSVLAMPILSPTRRSGKGQPPGFTRGYAAFSRTAARPVPQSRSAFQIAALGNPGGLVEIEVTAAKTT